jgi:HK97 family phage portal protein
VNILESFKNFFGSEKRETLELNQDDQRLMELLGIEVGDINVKGKNALKVDTVFACIRILSESLAKLPLKTYKEDELGIKKAVKHHVYSLLKLRPNPYMSALDFWKCVEAQRDLHGNGYANIEFDRKTGKIVGLWPIDTTKVKVMVDDRSAQSGVINNKSRIWYQVDVGGGQKRKIMPYEMLHFKGGITLDGIVGVPPLDYLRYTVENAASSAKFINNFFKQGLQVKGLIQYVGDLDEKSKQKFREKFESMSSGLKNSHRIALMPVGYQFVPMSLNMHDAQFLENTQMTMRQIATAFGIKMHQLNDLSKSTHTNIEHQQRQFYTETLQAILTTYEQEMTYKLFLDSEIEAGYYCKFNVDAILRADIKTRYEAYRTGIQGGFLKPNEARAKEELPPEEGGDQLLVNGNMMPISMAGQQYSKGGDETGKGEENTEGSEGDSGSSGNSGNS